MDKIRVQALYTSFMGEISAIDICTPVIILRLSGCNLRCYKNTLGTLCDTPEALDIKSGSEVSIVELVRDILKIRDTTKINNILITGGEPLLQKLSLINLINKIKYSFKNIIIETNGTQYIEIIKKLSSNVHFVIDIKLSSTGHSSTDVDILKSSQFVDSKDVYKFVIANSKDFKQAEDIADMLFLTTKAKLAFSNFWGGEFDIFSMFKKMEGSESGLLHRVTLSTQVHKLAKTSTYEKNFNFPEKI